MRSSENKTFSGMSGALLGMLLVENGNKLVSKTDPFKTCYSHIAAIMKVMSLSGKLLKLVELAEGAYFV